jgi:hypothetical protein
MSAISGGGGPPGAGGGEVTVSMIRRSLPWIVGVLGILALAGSAVPQGSLDAGKSPAQMFADTCSNCHRRPSELKRTSASFLRQHYTPGAQEAAAMATYLSSVPQDPRAGKDRGKAAPQDKEKAKVQQPPPQPPQQQAQERPQDRPKAQQQPNAKAKRPELAKSPQPEPPAAEAPPVELRVEAPPVPKLEPFEE